MTLQLITGRANTGKTRPIYNTLEESVSRGESPVLLLPSAPEVLRATREFALKGLVGVRVATFGAWADELWSLHGDGRRLVGDVLRAVIVGRAVESVGLAALAPSAQHSGFSDLVGEVVRRLPPKVDPARTEAGKELAVVVGAYRAFLEEEGLVEPVAAMWHLAEEAPRVGGVVAANRFTDLSPSQEALLAGLANRNEVMVALTWERDFPATSALDGLVARLGAVAASVRHEQTEPSEGPLAVLEAELYRPRGHAGVSEAVSFGLAAGEEAECALVAQEAAAAIAIGVEPDRIAVVFPDVSRRAANLETAFASEGLSIDLDAALPFATTPFGRALTALLASCREGDASRERLLAFLQSPYSGADSRQVAEADRVWRRRRLHGAELIADARRLGTSDDLVGMAARLYARPLDGAAATEWNNLASQMLAHAHSARGLAGREGASDAAAHRALLRAVSELAAAAGFGSDLARVLGRATASPGSAERHGRVQVMETHLVQSRRFDVLILGGLTQGEFAAEQRESLASALLRELGAPAEPDAGLVRRMQFYLLVTRARKRLVLVRQNSSSAGEAIAAATVFDEVLDVCRQAGDAEAEFPSDVFVRRVSLRQLETSAPAFQPGRRRLRASSFGAAPQHPERGLLEAPTVLQALRATDEFSVSELETYLKCPYSWFYDRAVRPGEIDVEVGAAEAGSRAHRILQEFYGAWNLEFGETRVTPENLGTALKALDDVDRRVHAEGRLAASGLAEELRLSRASTWARRIVEDDAAFLSEFTPTEHEYRFGASEGRPVELGGVKLRGSIDRVERRDDDLVVTDYKSSATIYGFKQFAAHSVIQIPAYAAVAQTLLGGRVVAGLYRSLRSLAVRGFWDSDETELGSRTTRTDKLQVDEVGALLARTEERIASAAEGIRSGLIEATPATAASCKFCGARNVCGKAR